MEDEVAITNDTFVRSTVDPAAGASSKSLSWIKSAANSYRTPLIVIGIIISAVILAAAVPAGMMLKKTDGTKGININNYNSTQASSINPNQVCGTAAAEQEEEEENTEKGRPSAISYGTDRS